MYNFKVGDKVIWVTPRKSFSPSTVFTVRVRNDDWYGISPNDMELIYDYVHRSNLLPAREGLFLIKLRQIW